MRAEWVRGLSLVGLGSSKWTGNAERERGWLDVQSSRTSLALFSTEYLLTIHLAEITQFIAGMRRFSCSSQVTAK